ncbi:glycosyltransferase [Stutzerimonas nitrititolerans]|uniref:glycosyltransferase n=1 Tax=Stutzerimonas nitrititolerans TaxID=2482751 RepID=UPI00289A9BBB|nr:glycosyltransferase [Stutzerimonas nitrititolerans]
MSEVVFDRDVLAGMKARLAAAKQIKDFETLLIDAALVVEHIVKDKTASGRVLDSEAMDALVQGVGRKLADLKSSSAKGSPSARPLRMYLATELYVFGGHSRMLEDFVRAAPEYDHLVIVSNFFRTGGGAVQAHGQLKALGAKVQVLENDLSIVDRTLRLMELLRQHPASACILFNHHQDVSIVAACQPEYCGNYYFYHHADHNLCLGARIKHLRHIDLTTPQFQRCEAWQDDNIYLPISCEDKPLRRDSNRSKSDTLVTATAGSWVKFSSKYHVSFEDFLCATLGQTNGRHIHFGDIPSERLASVWRRLGEKGIGSSHFEHVPWVPSLWEAVVGKGVDIYLTSFPIGGGRAAIEMMGAGVPVIFHANSSPYFVAEELRYLGAGCWTYLDQLTEALAAYSSVEVLQRHSAYAREHYERYFSDAVFRQALQELGRSRNTDILPPLQPFYQDGVRFYLEGGGGPESGAAAQPSSKSQAEAVAQKSSLDKWLALRSVSEIHRKLIHERLERMGRSSLCVLLMDNGTEPNGWQETCASLAQVGEFGLDISVIHIADKPVAVNIAGLTYEHMTLERNWAAVLNACLQRSGAEWVVLVDSGATFSRSGLCVLSMDLPEAQSCIAIYADEIVQDGAGMGALFRPDFNLDLLLSLPAATARHWLFRREACLQLGGFDSDYAGATEFEFIVRLIEEKGIATIGHIAEPLVISKSINLITVEDELRVLERHLQRRGYPDGKILAEQQGHYRLVYGHPDKPMVSIIVPTKDQLPMLQRCVESLLEGTAYANYELLIVDNNSETPEALAWFAGIEAMKEDRVRILRYPHPFNYSAINNMAAREARGEYLVLLNNDTAVISESWLDELLNHAQRPEVGIVGAKLLYPDGRIQHAGVVLGLCGPAEHVFIGEPVDAPGYMQRLQVDQNYSAVTAACLMVRKSIYEQVGGLDESFTVSYNDVDFCLKVREAGYLLVWTPHAVVMHEGSVSQSKVDKNTPEAKRKRFISEQDAMYAKWLPQLARDPAYNPNFSLVQPGGFKLADTQISWRPLDSWRPLPVVLAHPADTMGCGHYRVMQPFNALREAGMVDGALSVGLMHVVDLERYNPDAVILQRQIGEERLEAMRRIKAFSRAFKVYELDDYLPNLPMKSVHRRHMPKDIVKSLRRGLSYVDRFVVSTDVMAEAFAEFHPDIRVVRNRLDPRWWGGLPTSARRASNKPRVGWAGGASHTGDLEMITDVVKELADEVEWVFFGMCPEKLKPYIHEFHEGVAIERYAEKLASLNLDLALAPVEQNLFNECKSNLRLLEYGACGFPVICSDVRCYQGDGLPVTRVKNRFRDWVDAIRSHINDLDAAARTGDDLRAAVLGGWMLEGENLEAWRKAWLPS